MNAENLDNSLQKIGLNEKEARVYVATLELGPSPVQKISLRSGVPRATTYLVLEDLQNRGLITTFEKGKKTFFAAESPDVLMDLVENRSLEIQQQKALLQELIPELTLRGQFEKSTRPVVRYYEGIKALRSYIRDLLAGPEKEIFGMFVHEDATRLLERADLNWTTIADMRHKAKQKRHMICVFRGEKPPTNVHKNQEEGRIFVPYAEFPLQADITIKGNLIGFMPYSEPVRGVVIEDKTIAASMKLIFNALCVKEKSIDKNKNSR